MPVPGSTSSFVPADVPSVDQISLPDSKMATPPTSTTSAPSKKPEFSSTTNVPLSVPSDIHKSPLAVNSRPASNENMPVIREEPSIVISFKTCVPPNVPSEIHNSSP